MWSHGKQSRPTLSISVESAEKLHLAAINQQTVYSIDALAAADPKTKVQRNSRWEIDPTPFFSYRSSSSWQVGNGTKSYAGAAERDRPSACEQLLRAHYKTTARGVLRVLFSPGRQCARTSSLFRAKPLSNSRESPKPWTLFSAIVGFRREKKQPPWSDLPTPPSARTHHHPQSHCCFCQEVQLIRFQRPQSISLWRIPSSSFSKHKRKKAGKAFQLANSWLSRIVLLQWSNQQILATNKSETTTTDETTILSTSLLSLSSTKAPNHRQERPKKREKDEASRSSCKPTN